MLQLHRAWLDRLHVCEYEKLENYKYAYNPSDLTRQLPL